MIRRRLAILLAVPLALGLLGAVPATAEPASAADFSGIVALSNCSGSVVRLADSAPDDPALVLSNGHCLEPGFPAPGEIIVNRPSQRTFDLLASDGTSTVGTLRANKLAYATMTGTDTSLYQLDTSYRQLQSTYGVSGRTLSSTHPQPGTDMDVISGYWKKIYSCKVDGFVPRLREGDWTWRDSLRYTSGCDTIGGTSGSPIVNTDSGEVIGVNNTGNEHGERCTMNNPCEVAPNGEVTVRPGTKYGQQTYLFYGCLDAGNEINLGMPGCHLPKPTPGSPKALGELIKPLTQPA